MQKEGELWHIFRLKRDMSEIFFKAFFHSHQFPEGLNPTLMQTMIYLDILGPCPMTRISQILQLEKGSFTPVARRLVDLGYVVKSRNQDDKRIFELQLTPEGEELVQEFKKDHWDFIHKSLGVIPKEEQKEYFSLLDKLNTINAKLREELGIKGIFE